MNTFISIIPLQSPGNLHFMVYEPQENCIETIMETHFPIVPVIADCVKANPKEPIKVIELMLEENENVVTNVQVLEDEINGLVAGTEIALEFVKMKISNKLFQENFVNAFLDLLELIGEEEDIFACVTFGPKCYSTILSYFLESLFYLREHTVVRGIYYGDVERFANGEVRGRLYNVSRMIFLNRAIVTLSQLHVENPEGELRKLIKDTSSDEESREE